MDVTFFLLERELCFPIGGEGFRVKIGFHPNTAIYSHNTNEAIFLLERHER